MAFAGSLSPFHHQLAHHAAGFSLFGGWMLKVLLALVGLGVLLICVGTFLHRGQNRSDWASPGLYGAVGRMGGGKSYLLSFVGVTAAERGRPVYANFELSGAQRVRCWADVLEVPDGSVVLLDEVHLWWGREMWRAPADVMGWASQLRKRGITMLYASQHEGFVSTRLLRLTFAFWQCVRYRAGHQYTLFEGSTFGTPSKRERMSRMYVKRTAKVMEAYDTKEIVSASVEWGDGQGFEKLSVKAPARTATPAPGPAERSGPAPGPRLAVVRSISAVDRSDLI